MASVLVVDDSPADRLLVAELLSRSPGVEFQYAVNGAKSVDSKSVCELAAGVSPLEIDYAVNGREALAKIGRCRPELVITDLFVPEINGLQLVSTIRENHPQVPVILMTSHGSEEIAVQALQQGAASYVPKKFMMRYLWETIAKVLKASVEDRGQTRLLGCMLRTENIFHLENDPTLFDPLIRYLQQETIRLGVCTEADRVRVGVALEEALANALYHGNLSFDSDASGQPDYQMQIAKRRADPAFSERRIEVEARISRSEAAFAIRDEGCGFDPSKLPDPADPGNIARGCGRGIFLMRSFMDEVRYNAAGNAVVMVKRKTNMSGKV